MANNNIKALLDQQYGFSRWTNCDSAIKRLRCTKQNAYTQMFLPTVNFEEDELVRDTPIFACKFAPQGSNEHFVALANEDGKLAIHNTDNHTRYGVEAHNNAIFDLAWTFDQMKIVTASGDHTSKMFDVGNGEIRQEKVFFGHTRSVKTVAFQRECSSVFATGGRDGNIIVWDTRTELRNLIGQPDNKIANSHNNKVFTPSKSRKKCLTPTNSAIKSVTGLVFQDDNTLISCGAGDGVIKVWDLRKNYFVHKKEALPKFSIPYAGSTSKNGFSSLIIDKACVKLYANCLDNTIYCYNLSSYSSQPVMTYSGHQNNTFYIKSSLCKNGDYLVSGSSDENAYIWNIKRSQPLVKLTGHNAEVTCVAWCNTASNTLITCSDDMTHKIWMVGTEELPENWDIIGMGKAEVLPLERSLKRNKLKRNLPAANDTPKKLLKLCLQCASATDGRVCNTCCVTFTSSSKRKRVNDLFCNDSNKRLHTELGPRRLFSDLSLSQNIPKQPQTLATILEAGDENDCSFMKNSISTLVDKNCFLLRSPTVNLPNFVLDGTAPHLNYSPPKRKHQDWLTKIRVERSLRQEMLDKSAGVTPSKVPKLELTPSKIRGQCCSPQSPLLRFFKVTNKCEGHTCSSKAQCSGFVASSPQSSQ